MRNFIGFLGLCGISLFLFSPAAQGETGRSKGFLQVQKLQNRGNEDAGYLIGFRSASYLAKSDMYWGYELHAGSASGRRLEDDHLTYGGLAFGTDGVAGGTITYDLSTAVGYGFGSIGSLAYQGHSAAIHPTLSLGLVLQNGYRASFSAGYLYLPSASPFSTFTFGIRIERKVTYNPTYGNN